MREIQARLAAVAAEVLQVQVGAGQDLVRITTPNWDSLAHIRLVLAIEEEFNVRFSAEEVGAVQSLAELAALVGQKL